MGYNKNNSKGMPKHGHHMVNSWEEEDVKRGKKEMKEGHYEHGEDLFDDAHGSYNWKGGNHGSEPFHMQGSFMSKHAGNSYFHKQNLLDDMPVDDHASGLHMEGPLKQSFQSFRDVRPEVNTMNEMTWSDDLKRERRMPGFAETPTGGVQRAATENMAEAKKNRVENAIKGEVLKKKINEQGSALHQSINEFEIQKNIKDGKRKKGKISEKRAFKKVEKGKATVHYKSGTSGETIIKQPGRRDKVIKNYNSLQQ